LKTVKDKNISAIIVWLPCIGTDSRFAALEQSNSFKDPRVQYYWDFDRATGYAWQTTLGLQDTFAWDVYFLFDRGVPWSDPAPKPTFWMHQLPAAKEKAPVLDTTAFTTRLKDLLKNTSSDR
jgi:hypothetical protein